MGCGVKKKIIILKINIKSILIRLQRPVLPRTKSRSRDRASDERLINLSNSSLPLDVSQLVLVFRRGCFIMPNQNSQKGEALSNINFLLQFLKGLRLYLLVCNIIRHPRLKTRTSFGHPRLKTRTSCGE